jgi:hypothetical protein
VGEDGTADWVGEQDLAHVLSDVLAVRLVFLQACESALPSPEQAISGVAMRLAHINIPAVLAMQYRIEQGVANRFAGAFYGALVEGQTIDAAVQQGRIEIAVRARHWAVSRAFGLPVLYLREPEALLARPDPGAAAPPAAGSASQP